jgi:hypothetical protein
MLVHLERLIDASIVCEEHCDAIAQVAQAIAPPTIEESAEALIEAYRRTFHVPPTIDIVIEVRPRRIEGRHE